MHSFLIQLYLLQCKKLTKINLFCLLRNMDVKQTWPVGKHPACDSNKAMLSWGTVSCLTALENKKKFWEKIIECNWKLFQGNQPQKSNLHTENWSGGKSWDLLTCHIHDLVQQLGPWSYLEAVAGHAGQLRNAKNEKKLIFRLPSLGPVCQARLDHSLVTDGCNPWRAKNPSQKFTEVHGRARAASRAAGSGSCTPEGHRGQGALKTASKSSRLKNCLPCIPKSSPNGSSNGLEELPPWKRKMTVYFCRLLIASLWPSLDLHASWIPNMSGVLQEMLFPCCVPHPVELGFGSFQ